MHILNGPLTLVSLSITGLLTFVFVSTTLVPIDALPQVLILPGNYIYAGLSIVNLKCAYTIRNILIAPTLTYITVDANSVLAVCASNASPVVQSSRSPRVRVSNITD